MNYILKDNETMEDVLGRLVESFEWVHDVAPIAYWYEDLFENGRLKEIHYSEQMREMLGYGSAEEFPDELDTLMTHIHPEDVQLMLDNAIAAGTGRIDRYDVQYRIRRADGEYIWVNATGQVIKNTAGKTVGMYGAFIDVSHEVAFNREQRQLAKQSAFTSYFLEPYLSAYYVGFDDLSCKVYKRTKELEESYPIITNYVESITGYMLLCKRSRQPALP